jgi:hypothetical protein
MMRERGGGGTRTGFTNYSVRVSVERGERAGYRSVNCWSGSMASSESAVWMGNTKCCNSTFPQKIQEAT